MTIPDGGAVLTYWYFNGLVSAPFDATLTVRFDGKPLRTHVEAATADAGYARQTIDLTAFADGESHTLKLDYLNPSLDTGSSVNNMSVDDISIDTVDGVRAAPASLGAIADGGVKLPVGRPAAGRDLRGVRPGRPAHRRGGQDGVRTPAHVDR